MSKTQNSSPTMSSRKGYPLRARDASSPEITAASTQPTFRPVRVQSPARYKFVNSLASWAPRRKRELPTRLSV